MRNTAYEWRISDWSSDVCSSDLLSKLRLLGSVGEPINPEAWMWYPKAIGNEKLPIVDTWWQTETGSIMTAPIPGAVPTKPGSCTKPLPGIAVEVVDDAGEILTQTAVGGYHVASKPGPPRLRPTSS